MAFHIPFNQRRSAQTRPGPIYIGFETPRAYSAPHQPRRKFNWWGFNGMWMSFASLLSLGFLSPASLLISLVGLRRPGRAMASLGTIVSSLGLLMATGIVFASVSAHNHHESSRQHAYNHRVELKQRAETKQLLAMASSELLDYRDSNEGNLPEDIDGNMLVIKHIDPWGESLRFDSEIDHGIVRSAGPDQEFDTRDDLKVAIKGTTDRQPLFPMDENLPMDEN